jgi:hypothetical protein
MIRRPLIVGAVDTAPRAANPVVQISRLNNRVTYERPPLLQQRLEQNVNSNDERDFRMSLLEELLSILSNILDMRNDQIGVIRREDEVVTVSQVLCDIYNKLVPDDNRQIEMMSAIDAYTQQLPNEFAPANATAESARTTLSTGIELKMRELANLVTLNAGKEQFVNKFLDLVRYVSSEMTKELRDVLTSNRNGPETFFTLIQDIRLRLRSSNAGFTLSLLQTFNDIAAEYPFLADGGDIAHDIGAPFVLKASLTAALREAQFTAHQVGTADWDVFVTPTIRYMFDYMKKYYDAYKALAIVHQDYVQYKLFWETVNSDKAGTIIQKEFRLNEKRIGLFMSEIKDYITQARGLPAQHYPVTPPRATAGRTFLKNITKHITCKECDDFITWIKEEQSPAREIFVYTCTLHMKQLRQHKLASTIVDYVDDNVYLVVVPPKAADDDGTATLTAAVSGTSVSPPSAM